MKLRRHAADPAAESAPPAAPRSGPVSAIVVDAAPPPQNLTARNYGDWVYVVANLQDGPTLLRSVVKLDPDRWLVPGTTVRIDFDPAAADAIHAFEMDWDSVAPIRDRAAAGDPVLTDPRAARQVALECAPIGPDRLRRPARRLALAAATSPRSARP